MKLPIMKTQKGTVLYFDDETFSYEATDIQDVKDSLNRDIANINNDVEGAMYAQNIVYMMKAMDEKRLYFN